MGVIPIVTDKKEILTTKEVAELLGYSMQAIRNWEKKGLEPVIKSPGGFRKYNRKDVLDFAKKLGLKT